MKTELILALRRQIRNLREMLTAAESNPRAKVSYVQELKKKLASAEKRIYRGTMNDER